MSFNKNNIHANSFIDNRYSVVLKKKKDKSYFSIQVKILALKMLNVVFDISLDTVIDYNPFVAML